MNQIQHKRPKRQTFNNKVVFAREVWHQCFAAFHITANLSPSLWTFFQDWWTGDVQHRRSSNSFLLPGLVCWELWRARCSFLYDQKSLSVTKALHSIRHNVVALQPSLPSPKVVHPISVVWRFPIRPAVKINVDGSARGNPGPSGAGVVLRDSHGIVLAAESISLGCRTNNEAELLAAFHGIRLAQQLGFQAPILESDSQLLVNWLHLKLPWPWQLFHLLHELSSSASSLQVQVVHVFREANSVADALAKLASSTQTSHSFTSSTLPREIRGLIALDQRQFPYVRC